MIRGWKTLTTGLATLVLLWAVAAPAAPEVHLSISKGFGEKLNVALPLFEFTGSGVAGPSEMRDVLAFDLGASGYFAPLENLDFVDETEADDRNLGRIKFQEWIALGSELLVKGVCEATASELSIEAVVYDVEQGSAIFGRRYAGEPAKWREAIHKLSDDIVQQITGERGIASTKIAYVSNVTGLKEIYVMDYDGANRVRVTRSEKMALYPDWFPGSERLIHTAYSDQGQEVRSIGLRGGTTEIASFPGLNAFAAVSPNGSDVALSLSRDGNTEIYRLRVDGTQPRRLTFGRSTESSPCWSPDGRRIAFVSDRSGSPQIYVMSSTGGAAERVTFQGRYNTSPDWSPKGGLLAFTSQVDGVFQICTVDVDTKEIIRLTTGGTPKEDPSWAPDGRHLVYSARSGGKSDLYMFDIYELEPVRLTSGAGDYLSPAWSR